MKKNRDYGRILVRSIPKKTIRVMKLTFFLLIFTTIQLVATESYSQLTKITLKLENVKISDVLKEIENQSEFFFLYSPKLIDVERTVSIDADKESIKDILSSILGDEISFKVYDRQVILTSSDLTSLPTAVQKLKITGAVTDKTGSPLPGVAVQVKGTAIGVVTDAAGKYTINDAPQNATLIFSFIGMAKQEIPTNGRMLINVVLQEEVVNLNEVVVTAFGIEKSSKSVVYSIQKISENTLNVTPQTNLINSLAGKVAGMTINRSGAGLGGSAKVLLRGYKSALGNNQPLYVVDGIPLVNFARENSGGTGFMQDYGDGISNLNSDDIKNISILKGAAAAALYGSQAENGVILITTKKGEAGVTKIDVTSSFTADQIAYTPKLQNSYGQTAPGSAESWGTHISNAKDNISEFFKTGNTLVNSINISTGTANAQTYLSYANTSAKGIVEGNDLSRHNLSIHQNASFFDNKLKLDAKVKIISQDINNNPVNGFQSGPLYGLYTFPRGLDFAPYKNYEIFDPVRNLNTQNWPFISMNNQNPYWVMHKMLFENKRDRIILNLGTQYDISSWLNIQLRGSVDRIYDLNTSKYYVGTAPQIGGVNGAYTISRTTSNQYYGDILLNLTHSFGKVQLKSVLGTSITDSRGSGEYSGSRFLNFANIFTIQNMSINSQTGHSSMSENHQQLQAAFGEVNLSYNDWLYFYVTGRNDWSSNLSYTPNGSYFYPSTGIGVILNQLMHLPEAISFAKLRASYAIVGNTVPLYVTNPLNYYDALGNISFNNTAPFADLKPEKTRSLELGTEIRFLQDQFSVDLTYYKTNSINQFFTIAVPPGTGYSYRFINGGNIQNSGFEVMAGYKTLPNRTFGWSTSISFSTNKNLIKKLATDVDQFYLSNDLNGVSSILKVGGSYGDLYGTLLKRDENGKVIISSDGYPILESGRSFVGNPNPKFKLGWNNDFSYKNFILSFLVDGSFGGKVMSITEQFLDGVGVSKASGDARDNGGVVIDGISQSTINPVTLVDPYKWYSTIGGLQHATGEYVYDATNVRLREVSLGYSLPARILGNGFVKNIRISLIGRNLMYLYLKAPFDPEITFSTMGGLSNIDVFSLPATRSFGFNLNISF